MLSNDCSPYLLNKRRVIFVNWSSRLKFYNHKMLFGTIYFLNDHKSNINIFFPLNKF